MRADNKIILGVSVGIVLILMASVFAFVVKNREEREMTAETEAYIIDVQTNYSRESDGLSVWSKANNLTVTYSFQLNGQRFERSENLSRNTAKNFKIGETAKICYNPQNHTELKLVIKTFVCGK